MKKRNLVLSVMATCLVSCFLLSGCNGQKQIDSETVKTVKVEEQAHLQDDTVSPTCQITIDYSYLAKSDAADSIVQRINRTIQAHILGKEYTRMNPEVAVDSFKNTYINNYRKDVNEFYQEDIKNGTPKDELPTWYNYEYGLTTYFSEGKEGILNFEKNTGKLLALKDVFMAGSEKPISDMLLEELITEMATRLEDSSITSLEGLQNAGILNSTNMYVPDNFLLEKEKVSFLYNKYDIAPYAVGIITLSLPYTSVEKYMIH